MIPREGGELGFFFKGPGVGQSAPDFALRTQDGKRWIRLSQYRGAKPVVLVRRGVFCSSPFTAENSGRPLAAALDLDCAAPWMASANQAPTKAPGKRQPKRQANSQGCPSFCCRSACAAPAKAPTILLTIAVTFTVRPPKTWRIARRTHGAERLAILPILGSFLGF